MGRLVRAYEVGDDLPPLVKEMTQEAINLFEGSSGELEASQFTDEETARETLGTEGTVASGRMSLSFALELLRRYFGSDVFNHTGTVDLRFLRPVRPGDTITFTGNGHRREPRGERQPGVGGHQGREPARRYHRRGSGQRGRAQRLPPPGRVAAAPKSEVQARYAGILSGPVIPKGLR